MNGRGEIQFHREAGVVVLSAAYLLTELVKKYSSDS